MQRVTACWVVAFSGLLGCGHVTDRTDAELEDPGSGGSDQVGQGGRAGSMAVMSAGQAGLGGGSPIMEPCGPASGSPTPLRALSSWEYRRSVEALTGTPASQPLPTDARLASPFGLSMYMSGAAVEALFAEAEAQGTAARATELPSCDPANPQPECASEFVDELVTRAFRQPLTSHESERYLALFNAASSVDGLEFGVDALLQAALMSPRFLYKAYLGDGSIAEGMLTPLTPHELATRLAYLLTGAPPDEVLLQEMTRGGQLEPIIGVQASRLLSTPQFREVAQRFHAQWFELDALAELEAPGLTPQLRDSMRVSADAFIDSIYRDQPNLRDLLQSPIGFVDATLAAHLGLTPQIQPGFVQIQLDAAVHAGVLTQAATLTRFDNPTQRGQLVRKRLLCSEVPPPPPDIVPDVEVKPGQTRREAWEQHRSNPACAACHQLMDPIGFGFEHFDELGRFRSTESDLPVDASGELLQAGETDGPFVGVPELAERLTDSSLVAECFVKTWWSYATQREVTDSDACTIQELRGTFEAADLGISDLVAALVQSPRFRLRDVHVVPAVPPPGLPSGSVSGQAERRQLVLDFSLAELQWFSQIVPLEDRPLVEQHMSSMRELEQKLSQVAP